MMIPWLQTKLLTLLVAAIPIGLLASMLYQLLKKLIERESALLDKVPPSVHRIYFGIVATILTGIAAALGIGLECPVEASCLTALTPETLQVALEACVAILVGLAGHALKKKVK